MRHLRFWLAGLMALSLCGCLEVQQHPTWAHGQYNGKPDNLQYQANFHNDPLYWQAALNDRQNKQNEYNRMH
jgi:hypothetical protein